MTTEAKEGRCFNGAGSGRGSGSGLTMLSGSFYISKQSKSRPQGEDAHFVCRDKQTIGLADGVGGWLRLGIDSGVYARELMTNAEIATQLWPTDEVVDPYTVLSEAYSKTKAQGSSTACIITLEGYSLHAVNLGDSGFLLLRKGRDIYQSPIQQRSFNSPYQLGNSNSCQSPSAADVFTTSVEAGDVVVAGTDGLFDNLFAIQIEEVVRSGEEQGLE